MANRILQSVKDVFAGLSGSGALARSDRYIGYLRWAGMLVVVVALSILAVRAALRLELRWDSFWYHIPFAAIRGGLDVPFELPEHLGHRFDGFPPLPHLVQGILWRISGSINATNVINFGAFAVFLGFCGSKLKAPVWLVAAVALTAPLVLIHSTVTYIDLFANSWLAIGTSSLLYAYHYEKHADRGLLVWGLIGLIAAAWSKFQLVPVVAMMFVLYGIYHLTRNAPEKRQRRIPLGMVLLAALIAALPYLKNIVYYHNPFWPIEIPLMAEVFPYAESMVANQRPPSLGDASQFELFFRSLFEVGYPTEYPYRARWIVDQGSAWSSFRMGGFWGVSVIVYLLASLTMGLLNGWKKAVVVAIAAVTVLCFVAILPQSHELRYYLFLPLTWAALTGMLFPVLRRYSSHLALTLSLVILGLFFYMSYINRANYAIEQIDYQSAADSWAASRWWARMTPGKTYCAVDMEPIGFMLTGPTLSEFNIVSRPDEQSCPDNAVMLKQPFVNPTAEQEQSIAMALNAVGDNPTASGYMYLSLAYYDAGSYSECIEACLDALELEPLNGIAYNNLCSCYNASGQWSKAITACEKALEISPDFELAQSNLEWARQQQQR